MLDNSALTNFETGDAQEDRVRHRGNGVYGAQVACACDHGLHLLHVKVSSSVRDTNCDSTNSDTNTVATQSG